MAQLAGLIYTSHGGFTTNPSSNWAKVRASRTYRVGTPIESQEELDEKWVRTENGKALLRDKLNEMQPDVLVIFGDDQAECFDFNNFPSLALFLGEQMCGRAPSAVPPEFRGNKKPEMVTFSGHPELAKHLFSGLIKQGFDPAFMMELPNPDQGMAHAITLPLAFFTDFEIPAVPILINAYYASQITAKRCYEVGQAVRGLIETFPGNLRVVVIGSGGLWHTPRQERSWLNEEFDRAGLDCLQGGDIAGWVKLFDDYVVPADDPSQDGTTVRRGVTGLPTSPGPQGGTRETLCWIAAGAVAEGRPAVIVDYIPIYASPVGNGFAYCDNP
jgi:hypothetical protein